MFHNPTVFTAHLGHSAHSQSAPRRGLGHVCERTCRHHPDDIHFEHRDLLHRRRTIGSRRVPVLAEVRKPLK